MPSLALSGKDKGRFFIFKNSFSPERAFLLLIIKFMKQKNQVSHQSLNLKTAEAVTPLHPDKICDQISDAVLDACLRRDPASRVAIETMGGHNIISLTGELSTRAQINIPTIVRQVAGNNYGIQINIDAQSPEIARGVDDGGAGDQGIMVGYACLDNEAFIPQELYLAKSLAQYIFSQHASDGKVQITLEANQLAVIVASFCGLSAVEILQLINSWLESKITLPDLKIYANPAGDWQQGGFLADTGLTGRKLVCDNYGPQIPIGGGAFSGKDYTKVDRSAAYMARKIAVDYLKKYQAKEVLIKLAYVIGVKEPVMALAEITSQQGEKILDPVYGYDLSPEGIADFLDLRNINYQAVAAWGSFGQGFVWDKPA